MKKLSSPAIAHRRTLSSVSILASRCLQGPSRPAREKRKIVWERGQDYIWRPSFIVVVASMPRRARSVGQVLLPVYGLGWGSHPPHLYFPPCVRPQLDQSEGRPTPDLVSSVSLLVNRAAQEEHDKKARGAAQGVCSQRGACTVGACVTSLAHW